MNRLKLIKKLEKLGFKFERHGGKHDIYSRNKQDIQVPRHKEIKEDLAKSILKKAM